MEDNIKEKAKKEAEEIWEKKLKKDFEEYIQNCLMETLKGLDSELVKFDQNMKSHIETLDSQFETKFNEKVSQIKEQINNAENPDEEVLANKKNPFYMK